MGGGYSRLRAIRVFACSSWERRLADARRRGSRRGEAHRPPPPPRIVAMGGRVQRETAALRDDLAVHDEVVGDVEGDAVLRAPPAEGGRRLARLAGDRHAALGRDAARPAVGREDAGGPALVERDLVRADAARVLPRVPLAGRGGERDEDEGEGEGEGEGPHGCPRRALFDVVSFVPSRRRVVARDQMLTGTAARLLS